MNVHTTICRWAFAVALVAGTVWATGALAMATVESVRGEVKAGTQQVAAKDEIPPSRRVTTGRDGQLVLRFEDGQSVVLGPNTEFMTVYYEYSRRSPRENRAIFEVTRGSARFSTGAIGLQGPGAVQVRTPQALIEVQRADFMLAIVNPLYATVLEGSIVLDNAVGRRTLAAGSSASVASAYAAPVGLAPSALPPAATSVFSSMSSVALAAPPAGTLAADDGDAGIGMAAAIAAAAAIAGVAAAFGGGGGGSSTPTHSP